MEDVVLGKAEAIERCVRRVREVHGGDTEAFLAELTRHESVLLNLQRSCKAAIDLAASRCDGTTVRFQGPEAIPRGTRRRCQEHRRASLWQP